MSYEKSYAYRLGLAESAISIAIERLEGGREPRDVATALRGILAQIKDKPPASTSHPDHSAGRADG